MIQRSKGSRHAGSESVLVQENPSGWKRWGTEKRGWRRLRGESGRHWCRPGGLPQLWQQPSTVVHASSARAAVRVAVRVQENFPLGSCSATAVWTRLSARHAVHAMRLDQAPGRADGEAPAVPHCRRVAAPRRIQDCHWRPRSASCPVLIAAEYEDRHEAQGLVDAVHL
jgi:hypothetical protein